MNKTPIYDQLCSIYGSPLAYPDNDPSDAGTVEFAIPALPGTTRQRRAGSGGNNTPQQGWFEDSPLPEPQHPQPGQRPHSY